MRMWISVSSLSQNNRCPPAYGENHRSVGIILESVLEGYAEYYSADLAEKVIRGLTENALKGKFTGGAIPFGYIINADHRGS